MTLAFRFGIICGQILECIAVAATKIKYLFEFMSIFALRVFVVQHNH